MSRNDSQLSRSIYNILCFVFSLRVKTVCTLLFTKWVSPEHSLKSRGGNSVYTRTLEVIQDYRIPLHIKPVRVPTISNDLSQKIFWKKVPLFWNKNSKFQKTVIQKAHSMKRFQKFLCGVDRHKKNWFLTSMTFLALAIFSIHEIVKKYPKMAGSKKVH